MTPVNEARGEVGISIGGADIVIAATMEGLARVSTELKCKSMTDLFTRLAEVELAATLAAIRHLTVRGDPTAAIAALNLSHMADIGKAFNAALSHHFKDEPGNVKAVAT